MWYFALVKNKKRQSFAPFFKKRAKLCLCKNKVWNRFRIWIIKEKKWKKCLKSRRRKTATCRHRGSTHTATQLLWRRERGGKKATFHPLFTPPPAHIFMTRLLKKVSKLFGNEKKEQHRNWHDFAWFYWPSKTSYIPLLEATAEKLTLCKCQWSTTTSTTHTHIVQSKGDDDFFSAALHRGSISKSLDIILVIFLTPRHLMGECQCSAALLHTRRTKYDDFSAALNRGSISESFDITVVIFLTPKGPGLEATASKKDHRLARNLN